MEWLDGITVAAAAFFAAGLTMYSGFGLGTVMLPVFALFFPVEMAVFATALVHGANNVFKVSLLGQHADAGVVWRFGIPAILAAFAGAALLAWLAQIHATFAIEVNEQALNQATPVKMLIGLLMIGFALFELVPRFRRLQFDRKYLPLGGAISGFFGGLSGHQGALRSAFLAKAGLDTQAFVGSNAVIGLLVDVSRTLVYLGMFYAMGLNGFEGWGLVLIGALAAFAGVLVGKKYLHKVTMTAVQVLVGMLLLVTGFALLIGVL